MLNIRGRINDKGEIVFQPGKLLIGNIQNEDHSNETSSKIDMELTVSVDVNKLITGIYGIVWATKSICQAEIICNALKVQKIEVEIINAGLSKKNMYLLRVAREEDIKPVLDFIHNDIGGLRLKPDWNYPEGERNQSFEQWINE